MILVVDLTELEAIRRLKYSYFRTLDLKQWDAFAQTLALDAVAHYGTKVYGEPVSLSGRDQIAGFMRDRLAGDIITVHVAQHPEIDQDGDRARGSWCFEDTVIAPQYGVLVRGAGYYEDEYRRDADGRWRIAETRYQRIYESSQSLDELPGFQLLANRWEKSGAATPDAR